MAFEGLKSKLKTGTTIAAGLVGLAGMPNNADAQVVLSFSGPQNVQVGVPTEYNLVIDSTNGNVSAAQIDSIVWQLGLTNNFNATISNIVTPISNDVFEGSSVTSAYNIVLGSSNYRDFDSGTRPSNVDNLNYATATVTFNTPGSYVFSYANADVLNSDGDPILPSVDYSSTFQVNATAVPEPSTTAGLVGLAALGAAAIGRRIRRKEERSNNPRPPAPVACQ